jgi:glucose/arabinose dehydrogenase
MGLAVCCYSIFHSTGFGFSLISGYKDKSERFLIFHSASLCLRCNNKLDMRKSSAEMVKDMNEIYYYNWNNWIECRIKQRNNRINAFQLDEFPYEIDIIAENLSIPWALALSDTGVLYFTERPGNIRVIENGLLLSQPLITMQAPFVSQGEGGLMGLVLDPEFSSNHYMYVMYSYTEDNQNYNRIVRLVEQNNKAYIDKVLLDFIPGGQAHVGGRLKIGPDNKLYATTGDAGNPALAQDITSLAGKILRINLDGSIPEDNPFFNSPVYSYGFRNPQGLTWNNNNVMYATEHGTTGHDEINLIEPGVNYGWPIMEGNEGSEEVIYQKPLIQSGENTWAPAGMAYVKEGPWAGKLLVAALRGQELLSFSLNETGNAILDMEAWLQNEFGRLRDVIEGKDGFIYLTTSNMDGRGNPYYGDDKIIRLKPKKN